MQLPECRHEWVFALKRDFPHLDFSLNGGILSAEEVDNILHHRINDRYAVPVPLMGQSLKLDSARFGV